MNQPVSAYIPCFNNQATLAATIASIRAQQPEIDDLCVIDDGSTDGSAELAESLGCLVLRNGSNLGRGAARARGMREAHHDLVLCCDATNVLPSDFLARALPWFSDPTVAAVCGRFEALTTETAVQRWRARHLFKSGVTSAVSRRAPLITGGAVVRKSLCDQVGGYNPALRHSEDADLGERLLASGFQVVCDPMMKITSQSNNTLGQVLERYWRWNAGKDEEVSIIGYAKQIAYSIKVMARQDFSERDPLCVPISLLSPHYQFWKSLYRKTMRPRQHPPSQS